MIKSLFAILPDLLPRSVDEGNAIRSSGMKYLGKMQNLARQAPEDRQYGKQQLLIAIEYFVEKIFQITHARNIVILSHVCVCMQERISALVPDSESPRYLTQ